MEKNDFYHLMEQRKYLRLDYLRTVTGIAKEISDILGPRTHVTLHSLLRECKKAGLITRGTIIKTSVSTNPDLSLARDECIRLVRRDVFDTSSTINDWRITMILVPEYMYDQCANICEKTNNAFKGKAPKKTAGNHAHSNMRYCAHQTEPILAHLLDESSDYGQCCTILRLLCELTFTLSGAKLISTVQLGRLLNERERRQHEVSHQVDPRKAESPIEKQKQRLVEALKEHAIVIMTIVA